MSRRRPSGPPPTVGQLLVLLFVVGLLFHFWPIALLLGALLLVDTLDQRWTRWLTQLRAPKPQPRPVTVQVPRLVTGTEVVSTHPAAVIKPQLLGKIVAPTREERVALGFEYGTDLVMVDWYGCDRRWENLQHLRSAS